MTPNNGGKVLTFYSYKGGTGRTMALANTAWILASNGKKVRLVDWDLEAPGLHRYFAPFLADPLFAETEGLMEFLNEYLIHATKPFVGRPELEAHIADDTDASVKPVQVLHNGAQLEVRLVAPAVAAVCVAVEVFATDAGLS